MANKAGEILGTVIITLVVITILMVSMIAAPFIAAGLTVFFIGFLVYMAIVESNEEESDKLP